MTSKHSSRPDDHLSVVAVNSGYAEDMALRSLSDVSVDSRWQSFLPATVPPPKALAVAMSAVRLVDSFIRFGHVAAATNPLSSPLELPELTLDFHGLVSADAVYIDEFSNSLAVPIAASELLSRCQSTWCGSLSIEISHLEPATAASTVASFRAVQESAVSRPTQAALLAQLASADALEEVFARRFPSVKRFGIEGSENMLSVFSGICTAARTQGVVEMILGVPHRGRYNLLHHVAGMPASDLFSAFEDHLIVQPAGAGDVNVHLGFVGLWPGDPDLAVSVVANPSHLETVTPVALGMTRARRDLGQNALAVSVHGDAAFCGQGIVSEVLQMQKLPGYQVGGSIHLVVDNQIGFTTDPVDGRSSRFASAPAKASDTPIIRVNGADSEACWRAGLLAVQLRALTASDVVVHMLSWRVHGHNEGDEPTFTQPQMYTTIRNLPTPFLQYQNILVSVGHATRFETDRQHLAAIEHFSATATAVRTALLPEISVLPLVAPVLPPSPVDTSVVAPVLLELASKLFTIPSDMHPKVQRILSDQHRELLAGSVAYATAESLALASLLEQGVNVRLSGQDTVRGTFAQRHAVLVNQVTGQRVSRFAAFRPGKFSVYDSLLSEYGALGFEYGYDVAATGRSLVLWEAQFGDFVNGAQIVIDTCLANGTSKWGYVSGLTLLLPHGADGQGPEHSSARVERFLQLATLGALQVCSPSNASQIFHLLRRQALTTPRCPLVVLTPKSQLRSAGSRSVLTDLTAGAWRPILVDGCPDNPRKVVLSYGKLGAEIVAALTARKITDVQVIRLEDLFPLPVAELTRLLAPTKVSGVDVVWCQEEMSNCGPAAHVLSTLQGQGFAIGLVTPALLPSNSPGSSSWAKRINTDLLERSLA